MGKLQQIIQAVDTSKFSWNEQNAFERIKICKTSAIEGAYKSICTNSECGAEKMNYQSCRNRSCECGFKKTENWIVDLINDMYPVKHFHTTMTIPHEFNPIYLYNKKEFTNVILRAARISLMKAIEKKWGVKGGGVMVFHSWGSDLKTHPHVHIIVPAGGVSKNGAWKSFKKDYIASDEVLAAIFRKEFIRELKLSLKKKKIIIPAQLGYIDMNYASFLDFIDGVYSKDWHVKSIINSGGDIKVVKYLGRYTNRVAITSSRIISHVDGMVTFQYKDYKNKNYKAVKTVSEDVFVESFARHIPAKGVVKCRRFGICSGTTKKIYLPVARIFRYGISARPANIIRETYSIVSRIDRVIRKASECSACECEMLSEIYFDST
jgi:hypothetical protein